ncbi:hypothetical protein J7S78_13860 [Klebsiella oxytoca]|uniref:Uncharacterized protein n=1 Tax=Klebsiella oxytoca TaxID=571 RepID=A0AAP2BID2_KLEOX|nr:hypothetical protein [Klebsiella oxytoca]MBQ0600879.1 hypothetical protein [Klebsiella oxytoca]
MKITTRYVTPNKPTPAGKEKHKKTASSPRKPLKYFRSIDFVYATIFFGFILFSTLRFDSKQNEAEISQSLGVVQSVTEYDRAFGTMSVTTDKTHFITNRQVGLMKGDVVTLEKLFSGKYQLCVVGKENCVEIKKNVALAIRPPV